MPLKALLHLLLGMMRLVLSLMFRGPKHQIHSFRSIKVTSNLAWLFARSKNQWPMGAPSRPGRVLAMIT